MSLLTDLKLITEFHFIFYHYSFPAPLSTHVMFTYSSTTEVKCQPSWSYRAFFDLNFKWYTFWVWSMQLRQVTRVSFFFPVSLWLWSGSWSPGHWIPTGTPEPSERVCVVLSCTPVHQSFVHRAYVPACVPALVYVAFGATLKRRRWASKMPACTALCEAACRQAAFDEQLFTMKLARHNAAAGGHLTRPRPDPPHLCLSKLIAD